MILLLNSKEESLTKISQTDEQFILDNNQNNESGSYIIKNNKSKKFEKNKHPSNSKKNELIKIKFSKAQTSFTPNIINSNSEIQICLFMTLGYVSKGVDIKLQTKFLNN